MKKKIIIPIAVIALLASCGSLMDDSENSDVATMEEIETTISSVSTPDITPAPTPTVSPEPTPEPMPTLSPEPTTEPAQSTPESVDNSKQHETTYVLNTSTMKIHFPSCKSVDKIKPENMVTTEKSLDELLDEGYTKCGNCWK